MYADLLCSKGYSIRSVLKQTTISSSFCGSHPGCTVCPPYVFLKAQTVNPGEHLDVSHQEVTFMNSLKDLPNVVSLFEFFYESLPDGRSVRVLVMEWVENDLMKDLQYRKTQNYPWPERDLIGLATDLIATLAEAERRGIVHRDIRLQNMFIDPATRKVKLGSFENSYFDPNIYGAVDGMVYGTPAYIREELKTPLITRERLPVHSTVKSDVYSLGVTLLAIAKLEAPLWPVQAMPSPEELMHKVKALNYGDKIKTMIWDMINPLLQNTLTFVKLEGKYCYRRAILEQPSFQWESEPYSRKPVAQSVEMGEEWVLPKQHESHAAYLQVQSESSPHPQSTSQDDFKEMIAPSNVLFCCDCGKNAQDLVTPPIILYCPGCRGMMFCDRECVSNYIEKVTLGYVKTDVICPHCSSLLNQSEIVEAYGGKDKFKEKVREYFERGLLCVCCKSKRATHFIECGHIYCKPCLDVYKTSIFAKRTTICSVCQAVTTKKPKEIAKGVRRWFSFGVCLNPGSKS